MMKHTRLKYLAIVVILGGLSGCSSHMMAIRYQPSSQPVTSNAPEKVRVGNIVDSRGTPSNWLGAIRGGYGNPLKKLYTDGDTAKVVATAFEDALRSRGLLALASDSNFRIDVALLKFDTSYYMNKEAHASFTMSLVHIPAGSTVFAQSYRTDNTQGGAGAGIFGDVNALASFANRTLNETIDKALDDPVFLSALRSSPPTANASDSIESRLKQLELLRDKNLITADEYETKRKSLIDGF